MAVRIALDAMGGDHAPEEVVRGGVAAARSGAVDVVLVGDEGRISAVLKGLDAKGLDLPIVHCSQVVEMDEHPGLAYRKKKDSSIVVGLNLVKSGGASAFVSAGNSGAVMASALFVLGRLTGAERPALGTVFPTTKGQAFLLDVGANADCRPVHLLEFAIMGSVYMEKVFGLKAPRVGILSIGEEATKGNQLVLESHGLLKESGLNFMGNVEGKDLPKGVADVVVTDGFTGNVAIKITEGVSEFLLGTIKEAITSRLHYKLAGLVLKPALKLAAKRLDYSEYGGAPLLGVNGVAIVAHGRSNAKAIASALRIAGQAVENGLVESIRQGLLERKNKEEHGGQRNGTSN
ncbi:MAG: phosphate acyltransferase PlsX [Dehalococcoidia bacterium]|nr:phosphate acyltransferase PlsX [Dehalococcoidia bacterium]